MIVRQVDNDDIGDKNENSDIDDNNNDDHNHNVDNGYKLATMVTIWDADNDERTFHSSQSYIGDTDYDAENI